MIPSYPIIFLLLVLIGLMMIHRETRRLDSPLKERVRDICTIGIIIFACGGMLKDYPLVIAGLLVNAYGAVLLLHDEFRKGKKGCGDR